MSWEDLLLHLDIGPSGAFLRVGLGVLFTLFVRTTLPQASTLAATLVLLVLLFGVKVAGVFGRNLVHAPPSVREAWLWRRRLASGHDSYQWRKLTWIGLGILGAGPLLGQRRPWELGLGGASLLSGIAAEGLWRRKRLPSMPPTRT